MAMFWLGLLACAAGPVVGEGARERRGGDTDEGEGDTWPEGAEAPVVRGSQEIVCDGSSQSGGETWVVQLQVDDPQGAWTVVSGEMDVVMPDGETRATYGLVCDSGVCSGSFREDYDGIGCALEGRITFRVLVEDEDGHFSDPVEVET